MITAVLLAAGASRRFGTAKLVQDLGGIAVVRRSVDALQDSRIADVIVVVPPAHDELRRALDGSVARLVVNPEAERGMGRSIACGVLATREETSAVLLALGDEPFVSTNALHRVLDRYESGDAQIVAPRFAGVIGHPVLFDRAVFGELAKLDGDRGARAIVERDPARVRYVEFDGPSPPDVDTPDDLALARRHAQNKSPSNPRDHA